MSLTYTLERMMTQQAVIQRNNAATDAGGETQRENWQPHLTVSCLMWWDKSEGARSANRTYVTPSRAVPMSEGGMICPLGTDITEQDRITEITDENGNQLINGIMKVTAVLYQQDHMEVDLFRTSLGA